MRRRNPSKKAIKRAAIRAARESAFLENRVVPSTFVRSAEAEQLLAERRQRIAMKQISS